MAMIGGDLLACWTTLVSPLMDEELSPQLIRSGADALDDSHRPPVVIIVDELRASFRDDGRRMNDSGELRRLDDGDTGGRWWCDGGSTCNRARADADRARPPAPTSFCCLLTTVKDDSEHCCCIGRASSCCCSSAASASLATASTGRAAACNGM